MFEQDQISLEAKQCIDRGWAVIPVHGTNNGKCECNDPLCNTPGKHPRISAWQSRATKDVEQITRWLNEHNSSNLGIVAGQTSELLIVDIDPRHGGDESLAKLEKEFGPLPKTPVSRTGGGGRHILFAYPPGQKIGNKVGVRKGIDIRSDNGFIVAPPSIHASGGSYRWDDVLHPDQIPLAALPEWFLNLLVKPNVSKRKSVARSGRIPDGERNDRLFKLACSLRAKGLSESAILGALAGSNEDLCEPPLSDAEIYRILDSALKYPSGGTAQAAETKISALPKQCAIKDGRLVWHEIKGDEIKETPLCNCVIRIQSEDIRDDGREKKTTFTVSGTLDNGKELPPVRVDSSRFSLMTWIMEVWGAGPIIQAGYMIRERLRVAIQLISQERKIRAIHTNLGWKHINGEWAYLHAGGAITSKGNQTTVCFDPDEGGMHDFLLVDPPESPRLIEAIRNSLWLTKSLAPKPIAYTLLAATYRAPACEALPVDSSVALVGPTGTHKSCMAAIFQAHSGSRFSYSNLPGNWQSTSNANGRKVFLVKDALCTFDDFVPDVSSDLDADRLIRAQGNGTGRGRMKADGTLCAPNVPRGIILITGEAPFKGQSLLARVMVLEIAPGDIDLEALTKAQAMAAEGKFVESMSGFLKWMAPQIDKLKIELPKRHRRFRELFTDVKSHKRTPDIAANLAIGLDLFLTYALDTSAISQDEFKHYWNEGCLALQTAAELQVRHQNAEDPCRRFLDVLNSAFISGAAHLADPRTNGLPEAHERWGWRADDGNVPMPKGERIGWVSGNEVWLQADAAYTVAQKLSNIQRTAIPVSKDMLCKKLAQQGFTLASEGEGRNVTKRYVLAAKERYRVLVFPNKAIFNSAPEAPEAPISLAGSQGSPKVPSVQSEKQPKSQTEVTS